MLSKIKKNISLKLFFIITGLFFIIITIILLGQSYFFESFYYNSKMTSLKNNVLKFKNDIDIKGSVAHIPYDNIYKFEDENNAIFAVLDSNFRYTYLHKPIQNSGDSNIKKDAYDDDLINMAINNWKQFGESYFDVVKNKETVTFEFQHPVLQTNNLVVVSPLVIKNKISNIIFVISTLQPVNEASNVMKQYYVYIYIFVIVLIVVFSLFFSRTVTKSLIAINKTAVKMASLDFTEKCHVNSNDELGTLANSLNFLSDNLNTALSNLTVANEDLKKEMEKELALEEMRKDFISSASHELKTPISLIEGYAEGLRDNIADETSRKFYLDVIIDEAKNMNKLVMDMLQSCEMDYGDFQLPQGSFCIYELLYNTTKSFSDAYTNKQFILNSYVSPELMVVGNEHNIEIVLRNVLSNAVNYSKEMSHIYIRLYSKFNSSDDIVIEIENEDSNIPDEDINLVWDKFYRAEKSRNKYSGGTGLGLNIVSSILTKHKSQFNICNTDIGVKFHFTLKKE
ncbi:Signal transduction histidine kinase [Hathewaya proteolytica DSM 3090]|uniref:histidine kinase n=1 Tax=Hathewaya proteolytica DSM 3090 TaxID=1121331 RepID=A0A1M6T4S0_9CLOT|nr:HAMP domain-containing sensor histidine kinase [Hathewaya proteolytica]SHK51995.1 Signal transduction histidine kinase [Hathewaya proteolytica DSM 3090]